MPWTLFDGEKKNNNKKRHLLEIFLNDQATASMTL